MHNKIIIVDDQKEVLDLLKELISRHYDYEIIAFTDSKKALEYININNENLNLIIADILMPGISGIELIEQCENVKHIPLLFLTGLDSDITVKSAFKLNDKVLTINYMVKPNSFTHFMAPFFYYYFFLK